MPRHRLFPFALLASVAGVSIAAGSGMRAQEQPAGRIVLSGQDLSRQDTVTLYSDSQATAGQAVWKKVCAECHETTDVTQADFKTKWGGRPVFALFEQIRTTMPDGNPGTLPREDYAATVAYILKLNGLPAGTSPLSNDSTVLAGATLKFPATGH